METQKEVEILFVEDNPNDAEMTMRALKRNNIVNHIVHVEYGAEALDFLFTRGNYCDRKTRKNPKLVILDLKLPGLSGLEVLLTPPMNFSNSKFPKTWSRSSCFCRPWLL